MKLYKKLILSLGVTLMVATPLFALAPQFVGKAAAAPVNQATYADETESFILMHAVSACFLKGHLSGALVSSSTFNGAISPEAAVSYLWFGPTVGLQGNNPAQAGTGYLDTSGKADGWNYCPEQSWLNNALQFWGISNPIEALCAIGMQRADGSNCVNSSSGAALVEPNLDGNGNTTSVGQAKMAAGFRQYINNLYYGKNNSAFPSLSDPANYVFYSQSFLKLCGPPVAYPTGNNLSDGDIAATSTLYRLTAADGTTRTTFQSSKHHDDIVTVRNADTGELQNDKCWTLVTNANKYAAAYANGDPSKQGGIDDGTGQSVDTSQGIDTSCGGFIDTSSPGGFLTSPLRWLVCPVVKGFAGAASVLDNGINSMLCINEAQVFDASSTSSCSGGSDAKTVTAYKQAWNVFRIIALGLIAIAGLVMVLSQTMGLEFVDAYTIKKVLPRLLVAAIGVTLSWQLMEFFVTLTNLLGLGIRSLIYAPFVSAGIDKVALGGGGSAVAALTTGSALALLGPLGILSLVATGLLAILVAFVVLVLRNIVVILLILTAPVAIVAYVLPNTQKIWAFWWDAFTKALMMFPIITAFIAAGRVFAAISTTQAENLSGVASLIASIVGFIAYFAPYFLIPLTLRFAGGALGTLGGFANDRSRGAFDRLKKYRGQKAAGNYGRMRQGNLFRGGVQEGENRNWRGRINTGFQRGTNASLENIGANPANWGARMRSTLATQEFDHAMEGSEKDAAMRAILPDDDMLSAGLAGNEAAVRSYLANPEGPNRSGRHLEDSVAQVMQAKRSMGANAFNIAAAVGLAGTKTGYAGEYDADGNLTGKTGTEQMMESLNRASGGDKALASRMYGVARGQAGRAGRLDLAGHGFGQGVGELFNTIDKDIRDPSVGGTAINDRLNIDTFLNNDAVTIGRSDSRAVRNIMDSVGRRIVDLDNQVKDPVTDEGTRVKAREELGRLSGGLENMRDQGFYFAPQRIQTVVKAINRTSPQRQEVQDAVNSPASPTNNPGAGGLATPNQPQVDSYLEQRPEGPGGRRGAQGTLGANDPNLPQPPDEPQPPRP